MSKQKNIRKLDLKSPCTITEAVQIARGVAEDVVEEYKESASHLQVALALQVEILKDFVIKAGLITEEEFRESYMKKVDDFNKAQKEYENSLHEVSDSDEHTEDSPKMTVNVNDISVDIEGA